jgi:hypothetical protein
MAKVLQFSPKLPFQHKPTLLYDHFRTQISLPLGGLSAVKLPSFKDDLIVHLASSLP